MLSIFENIIVLSFNVVWLSVKDCFSIIFFILVWRERGWRESSVNIEKWVWRFWEEGWGAEILCLCSGSFEKYWWGPVTWVRLARFSAFSAPKLHSTKINFAIISQPNQSARLVSWDPSIVMPRSRVEIFQVISFARRPGERTERQTGQRVTHCSCALLPICILKWRLRASSLFM